MTYRIYFNKEKDYFEKFAKTNKASYIEQISNDMRAVWKFDDNKTDKEKVAKEIQIFNASFCLEQNGWFSFGMINPECDNHETYYKDNSQQSINALSVIMHPSTINWMIKMLVIAEKYDKNKGEKQK